MAGRGRGRGRGMSFSVEMFGFGRGEALPGPIMQPPPPFAPLEYKPVPLEPSDEATYLLALKQEYRGFMKDSTFFIKAEEKKTDITRYSDKYQIGQSDEIEQIYPTDLSRFPKELQIKRKLKRKTVSAATPALNKKRHKVNADKKLEELEKKEQKEETEVGKEESEDEDEEEKAEWDEDADEEEVEEDNDYNLNYFDNGEGFGMEDEDDEEGPVY